MKFYTNKIDQVITGIKKGDIKSVLIYGPDSGITYSILSQISKALSLNIITKDPESSEDLGFALNNTNFFSQKDIIKISANSLKISNSLKDIILSENHNFLVLIGADLDKASAIRKFFETEKNLAAIACYPDDERGIKAILLKAIGAAQMRIDPAALDKFASMLSGNRAMIESEINKLILYKNNTGKIDYEDIKAVISSHTEESPDEMCIYFATKDAENYLKELDNILKNDVSPVWVIRALSRYFINLLIVKLRQIDGMQLQDAMSKLSPPIFFKYQESFSQNASKFSINYITSTLELLSKAEIDAKNFHEEHALNNLFIKHF